MNPENLIDCQGLPCPQPVLRCKEIITRHNPGEISVLVDNEPALENVSRYLTHQGYTLHKPEQSKGGWIVFGSRDLKNQQKAPSPAASDMNDLRTLILISKDKIGKGDDDLGTRLMLNFLATLPEMGKDLWKIILVNSGVRLAIENSPALDSLLKLEKQGSSILVCGTCLEFFKLTDKRRTGQTTNMLDIISGMNVADKVITL
ncbi:MAG: sulfurtransferase-like selenium metabolism protein YedF [Desulfonatronovibrio sp.]